MPTIIWLWRAFNKNRERICDCGIARAATAGEARQIAAMALGGPYMLDVVEFEVTQVALPATTPGTRSSTSELIRNWKLSSSRCPSS